MYFKIIGQARKSPFSVFHVITWTILGGLFLLNLYFKDLWFMARTMLNLRDTDETDLFVINLNEEERDKLTKIYKKIYLVSADLMK